MLFRAGTLPRDVRRHVLGCSDRSGRLTGRARSRARGHSAAL